MGLSEHDRIFISLTWVAVSINWKTKALFALTGVLLITYSSVRLDNSRADTSPCLMLTFVLKALVDWFVILVCYIVATLFPFC